MTRWSETLLIHSVLWLVPGALWLAPAGARAQEPPYQAILFQDGVPEYRIGPGDELQVVMWVGPEKDEFDLLVRNDGKIFLPFFDINLLLVGGLTPGQLEEQLSSRLRGFVKEPFVSVTVSEYKAWKVTLLGEVAAPGPGSYALTGPTRALDFIFAHGGPTDDANLASVRISRDGKSETYDLLSAVLDGDEAENPFLDTGDAVFVPSKAVGGGKVFVLGQIGAPGFVEFTPGLTALDAVARAGSFLERADLDRVLVTRPGAEGREIIRVNLEQVIKEGRLDQNISLEDGDIIMVPAKGRGLQGVFQLLGPPLAIIYTAVLIAVTVD